MEMMIAYCGLACDTCPIHLATLEQEDQKKKSMRTSILKTCIEEYGMNLQIKDITDCDGCRIDKRLFTGCINCEIRKCALNRKIGSCAFCEEYSCEKLKKHLEIDPTAKIRLEEFRNIM